MTTNMLYFGESFLAEPKARGAPLLAWSQKQRGALQLVWSH